VGNASNLVREKNITDIAVEYNNAAINDVCFEYNFRPI
jgi:hypothetical protein